MHTGIIYLSTASVPFDEAALVDLARHAERRNAELEVTGYLFFEKGQFIQYVEGPRGPTVDLMGRIEQDDRHQVRKVFTDHEVSQRRFPNWRMRRVTGRSLISLERVLREHLELISMLPEGITMDDANVWRIVESLSRCRNQLQPA